MNADEQQLKNLVRDAFGVCSCKKCGAVGTIVEMGACCRVAKMLYGGRVPERTAEPARESE